MKVPSFVRDHAALFTVLFSLFVAAAVTFTVSACGTGTSVGSGSVTLNMKVR